MESYAINLVLPKLQNGTKWNVNSLQLEVLLFALILGLLRGMLGRSFLLELPPHARRIPCGSIGFLRFLGTTSACAENTNRPQRTGRGTRNYLRVRGEYQWNPPHHPHLGELPPRARRIRRFLLFLQGKAGTTSACAENTSPGHRTAIRSWNYLRVRGEYRLRPMVTACWRELPPRARRILATIGWHGCEPGTTSACAENTDGMLASQEP